MASARWRAKHSGGAARDTQFGKVKSKLSTIALVNHKPLSDIDGGTLRIRNIASGLVDRGHEVCFTSWQSSGGPGDPSSPSSSLPFKTILQKKPAERLFRAFGRIIAGVTGESAADIIACNLPTVALRNSTALKSADIVQVEQIWSALFPLLLRRVSNKVCLLDDHNVEVLLASRLAQYYESPLASAWVRYVSFLEKVCCNLADMILVTSEFDRQQLARTHSLSVNKIKVVPNGADVNRYKPDHALGIRTRKLLGISEDENVVAFVGRSSYQPNKLAIDYIESDLAGPILKVHPNTRFLVVSRDVPSGRERSSAHSDRFVYIPSGDDDRPYINASDVCIAPLTVGSGTRLKVLNYLACGKPVVSTRIGAEGLRDVGRRAMVVCELKEFPDRLIDLLGDRNRRAEMSNEAREFVSRNYSWTRSVALLDRIYDGLRTNNA